MGFRDHIQDEVVHKFAQYLKGLKKMKSFRMTISLGCKLSWMVCADPRKKKEKKKTRFHTRLASEEAPASEASLAAIDLSIARFV